MLSSSQVKRAACPFFGRAAPIPPGIFRRRDRLRRSVISDRSAIFRQDGVRVSGRPRATLRFFGRAEPVPPRIFASEGPALSVRDFCASDRFPSAAADRRYSSRVGILRTGGAPSLRGFLDRRSRSLRFLRLSIPVFSGAVRLRSSLRCCDKSGFHKDL